MVFLGITIPLEGAQSEDTGDLTFTAVNPGLSFKETLILESPNFVTTPPDTVTVSGCVINVNNLDFEAIDVLQLFDNIIPNVAIDLDSRVEDKLKEDGSLVTQPLEAEVCALFSSLAEQVGEFLIFNPLTDTSATGVLLGGGLIDVDGDGALDALEFEETVNLTEFDNVFNLRRSNFLVDLLFPEGGDNEFNVLSEFFTTFEIGDAVVNQSDAVGLIVALLNDNFEVNITRPIFNLDLIDILISIIGESQVGSTLIGGTEGNEILVVVNDTFATDFGNFSLRLTVDTFAISEAGGTNDEDSIFDGMEAIGNFTVLLPGIDLGDFDLDAELTLDVTGVFAGSDFLPPFDVVFPTESLSLRIDLKNLIAKAAGLIVVNEADLFDVQIGPLIDFTLDCLSSTLFTPSIVTGIAAEVDRIDANVDGFTDLITNLLGDIFNTVLFTYQSVIVRALETLLAGQLLDPPLTIFDINECPVVNESMPGATDPYNFSQGIFADIVRTADAEFFEQLIAFAVSPDGEKTLDLVSAGDNLDFGLDLFPVNGWFQRVDIFIESVQLLGISPPEVTEASFDVSKDSELFPQGIQVAASIGTEESPVFLDLKVHITLSHPALDPENTESDFVADEPPAALVDAAGNNTLDLLLEFSSIDAFLEIYAKLSRFAVEGTRIEDAIVLDCWVANLQSFGGWTDLAEVAIELASAKLDCNCSSEILLSLTTALNDASNWDALEETLQELLDLIVNILPQNYNEENFDFTVSNADLVCRGLDPIKKEFNGAASGDFDGAVYGFLGLLAVSLGFTCPCAVYTSVSKRMRVQPVDEFDPVKEKQETEDDLAKKEEQLRALEELETLNKEKTEFVPLYKNHHLPRVLRILMPMMLFMNFILFVYGDLGVAIVIGIAGNVFGAPILLDSFASFSVITSTIDLFKNGAVVLAILIFVLAIFWPYFKLISLNICYFGTPGKGLFCWLSVKRRGQFLHFLDTFGKWSLIEVFFVVFLRLVFELDVGSPRVDFLPDQDLYQIELLIAPQASYYTFAAAVVISIFLSNLMVVYHDRIVRQNQNDLRDIVNIKETDLSILVEIKLSEYEFKVNKRDIDNTPNYKYWLTKSGVRVLDFFTLACIIFTLIAATVPVVTVNYLGIAKLFLELEGASTTLQLSIFSLTQKVLSEGIAEGDAGAIFLVVVFVFAQLIAPFIVLLFSFWFLHRGLSLDKQLMFRTARTVIAAWSALEVFLLAVAVSVIEVPEIAGYITGESCSFITDFMVDTLLPLGLVSEIDVENTCFGIAVEIPIGGYVLLAAIFCNFVNAYIVTSLLSEMIKQRKKGEKKKEVFSADTANADPLANIDAEPTSETVQYSRRIRFFKTIGLLKAVRAE